MAEIEVTPSVAPSIPCPQCDATFTNRSGLSSHLRSAHKVVDKEAHAKWERRKKLIEARKTLGTGKFVCDVKGCGRRFKTPTGLGGHKSTIHGIAGQSGSSKWARNQKQAAMPTFFDTKKGLHICPECEQEFRFAKALGKHRSSKHNVPGSAKSTIAHKKKQQLLLASKIAKAAEPLGLVLAPEEHSLVCHCGKGPFKNINGLKIHQTTMHKEEGGELHGSNGTSTRNNNVEIATAFWLGRATERAEVIFAAYAERAALTGTEFASRSLAILQGSSPSLRKLFRLPN